jgi:hypothetical protein
LSNVNRHKISKSCFLGPGGTRASVIVSSGQIRLSWKPLRVTHCICRAGPLCLVVVDGQTDVRERQKSTDVNLIIHVSIRFQGAHGSVVGWGTNLQSGRSRVLILMRSPNLPIYIILPVALWPRPFTQPLTEMSTWKWF